MNGLIPPQAIEAEKSVLGAMLLEKQALSDVIQILTPEDFYKPEHVEICSVIYQLFESNKAIDIITVSERLKGKIGFEYFAELASIVPTTANVKTYAAMVKGKSIRRKYIRAAQSVLEMAYEGEFENVIDFKNDVLQKMDIEVKDRKKEQTHIKNITENVMLKIEERYNETQKDRFMYGIKWLDETTGGLERLTILAARPSIGKSSLASQIALNVADQGKHVAIFNLEMDKEAIGERMLTNLAGVEAKKIKKPKTLVDEEWDKIGSSQGVLAEMNIHIFDDIYKIEEIRATCRELKNKNQLDFVIVDYLQLCDTMKKTSSKNEMVSHLSRQFKLMQKEMGVRFWVLSQLTRENERSDRRPKLIDLRDSGSIEQDADNVIFLHDPNYGKYVEDTCFNGNEIQLIVVKERDGQRDIYTTLKFYKNTQRWYGDG